METPFGRGNDLSGSGNLVRQTPATLGTCRVAKVIKNGYIDSTMLIELLIPAVAAAFGALISLIRPILKRHVAKSPELESFFKSKVGQLFLKVLDLKETSGARSHQNLFADLAKASAEMDRIVGEIEAFTKGRQTAVAKIESDLRMLSAQESELKKRVEGLQNVPLPAAEFFAKIIEEREKKTTVRDYLLFLAGVVASAVVALVLKKFGIG